MKSPPKKCGAGFQPAHGRRQGQVGNLPHTFSLFQGVVSNDMNDSSEKVWGRFPTCPREAAGAGWKPAPHFFIVSGRRSRHERLLRNQPRRNEEHEERPNDYSCSSPRFPEKEGGFSPAGSANPPCVSPIQASSQIQLNAQPGVERRTEPGYRFRL